MIQTPNKWKGTWISLHQDTDQAEEPCDDISYYADSDCGDDGSRETFHFQARNEAVTDLRIMAATTM